MELFIFLILCCFGFLFWRDHKEIFEQNYTTVPEISRNEPETIVELPGSIDNTKLASLLDMEPYHEGFESLPLDTDLDICDSVDPEDIRS